MWTQLLTVSVSCCYSNAVQQTSPPLWLQTVVLYSHWSAGHLWQFYFQMPQYSPFDYLLKKNGSNTSYFPGTRVGSREAAVNKKGENSALTKLVFEWRRQTVHKWSILYLGCWWFLMREIQRGKRTQWVVRSRWELQWQCVFTHHPFLSMLSNPSLPVHFYNAELFSYLFVSRSPSKLCPGGALTFHNQSCLSKNFAKENIFSLERNNVSPLGAEAAAVSSSFKIAFLFLCHSWLHSLLYLKLGIRGEDG